jgi:Protein of unknown function (DUF2795)
MATGAGSRCPMATAEVPDHPVVPGRRGVPHGPRPTRPVGQHPVRPGPERRVLEMLASILADLRYPARLWQIVATAESYGADADTMTRLHRLPAVDYASLRHVAQTYIRDRASPM